MSKEMMTQLFNPLPPPPPPPNDPRKGSKPKIGFILSILSGLIIFVAAIVYLAVGNPVAEVLGIIFVIAGVFFAIKGYGAIDKKMRNLYGAIPMFIGFIIMIADGSLLGFDLAVLLGGFAMTLGGIFISAGK